MLLRWIVGGEYGFPLGSGLRTAITQRLEWQVPDRVFIGTDFHLDWLYAALLHVSGRWPLETPVTAADLATSSGKPVDSVLTASPEDLDLLLCWHYQGGYRMILIEAKAYGSWDNAQLTSKIKRLSAVFGQDGQAFPFITPKFVLTSLRPPQKVSVVGWPAWAVDAEKPVHLQMPSPSRLRYQTERCDEIGRRRRNQGYWRIRKSPGQL